MVKLYSPAFVYFVYSNALVHLPVDRHFVNLYTLNILNIYFIYILQACFGIPNLFFGEILDVG